MANAPKPTTIAELLQFCHDRDMPLRTMRFFIGEDYSGPKAFGVFQGPDGDFVVYKNKADGTRAIRYKGPNEAVAVNEIYEKLRSEIKKREGGSGGSRSRSGGIHSLFSWTNIMILTMIVIAIVIAVKAAGNPKRGYYRSGGRYYYYDSDDWYFYDDGWQLLDDFAWAEDDYDNYYIDDDFTGGSAYGDFRQSDYYDGYYERSTDYDDDDDWDFDFGGWDIGDTDWDTDW